jgi:hypothetical protein
MAKHLLRSRAAALLVQLLAVVLAVGVAFLAPPERGRMMLVPLSADAAHGMIALAVEHGAALVGPGSLPGSMVVDGRRADLIGALFAHGVALLGASAAGCGQ